MKSPYRLPSLCLVLALLLAGCPGDPTTPPKAVATSGATRTVSPTPSPTPTPARSVSPTPPPSLSPSPSPAATLTGRVELAVVPGTSFQASPAPFRVLAVPAAGVAITLSTLEDTPVAVNGKTLTATTDAEGRFTIPGPLPSDPYVLNAALARGHRLSAIVLPEANEVTLDEGSSMIVAMARNQIRGVPPETGAEAGRKTLKDLKFETLRTFLSEIRPLLAPTDFPGTGEPPTFATLQTSATAALRDQYMAKIGSKVVISGGAGPNRVSDAWKDLLGYRPLGVTRVAGSGQLLSLEGAAAREGALVGPMSAAEDLEGSVYVTERDGHRIRIVPKSALPPRLVASQGMAAGNLYTLAGSSDGPKTLEAYNAYYGAAEQASAVDANAAPKVYDPVAKKGYPLLSPYRLVLDKASSGGAHMYFTSYNGHRVMLIPAEDFSLYGRQFKAGRLYTLAGTGAALPATNAAERGDGGLATAARLYGPTGIARDSSGNLYVLDGGQLGAVQHGLIRLVRATDGRIVNVPLLRNGQPFTIIGAQDLRVVQAGTERFLYVTETRRHFVFRVPLPTNLTTPVAAEIQVVLGVPDQSGTIDTAKGQLPDPLSQGAGVAKEAILLNGPTSLEFDAQGNLLVADAGNGRILAVEQAATTSGAANAGAGTGKVHVIGGAFKSETLEGDARQVAFPQSTYLVRDIAGNLLLPDTKENTLRRIWTARGTF